MPPAQHGQRRGCRTVDSHAVDGGRASADALGDLFGLLPVLGADDDGG
jgi:hypothetical protein